MALRDHAPVIINKFNGLWDQGNADTCPQDHFSECNNIQYYDQSAFKTRYGIDPHQNVIGPLGNVVRAYNFITQLANTLLVLTYDGTTGKIYHVVDATTVHGPILTIVGMTDFAFTPFAGRAYISPFTTSVVGGLNVEKGMTSQFLYVYLGAGAPARKAAGVAPTGTLVAANGAAGHTDGGFKVFGVVFESDTGWLSAPAAFVGFTTSDALSVSFSSVPTSPDAWITKRHIVASINITDFNGDLEGYPVFFIPGATINNNVGTTLSNISFYDADLLEDATHLFDNYSEIPAGVSLSLYHNRLVLLTPATDINLGLISAAGEPEAISQLDGFISVTPDGNPLTNAQEMRDILYVTKRNRTVAYVDNGDVPSSWSSSVIDLALGCGVHGIATVIDSGSTSVDYLMVGTYRGICLFNGRYILPELSWKIYNLWLSQNKNDFRKIQIINDSINQILYIVMTDGRILIGNYSNGLDPMKIRWTPWSFKVNVSTICLVNINDLIIGSDGTFNG